MCNEPDVVKVMVWLQYLEELGVMNQVKRLAGASAGAMFASLMAVGYNSYEIEQFLSERIDKVFLGKLHVVLHVYGSKWGEFSILWRTVAMQCVFTYIIITITMYICHVLINALSAHMIHTESDLNLQTRTHTHTHARTHEPPPPPTHTHTHTSTVTHTYYQ